MEGGLIHHKRVHVVGGRKKKVKRRSLTMTTTTAMTMRRELPICATLQELYSMCKKVFKGRGGDVPSSQDVHSLCNILDRMKPADLGLREDHQFFTRGDCAVKNPRVTCTTVYRCLNFSFVLFFLPSSAVIPLHNHPDMTVFNKLLRGTMHIKAYDWVDPEDHGTQQFDQPSPSARLAKVKADAILTAPCTTKVLYPTSGGNIHSFTAITPCAFLDVLGPPYSKEDERDCTYYKDTIYTSAEGKLTKFKDDEQSYAWLEEIAMPESYKMDGIRYKGPSVIETAN